MQFKEYKNIERKHERLFLPLITPPALLPTVNNWEILFWFSYVFPYIHKAMKTYLVLFFLLIQVGSCYTYDFNLLLSRNTFGDLSISVHIHRPYFFKQLHRVPQYVYIIFIYSSFSEDTVLINATLQYFNVQGNNRIVFI